MPRTTIPVQVAAGNSSLVGVVLTETAADTVNLNQSPLTDGLMLLANNTSGGALTVTVTSAPDALGRVGDITALSLAAGEKRLLGPFNATGWLSAGGMLFYQASAVGVKFSPFKAS